MQFFDTVIFLNLDFWIRLEFLVKQKASGRSRVKVYDPAGNWEPSRYLWTLHFALKDRGLDRPLWGRHFTLGTVHFHPTRFFGNYHDHLILCQCLKIILEKQSFVKLHRKNNTVSDEYWLSLDLVWSHCKLTKFRHSAENWNHNCLISLF